MLSLLLGKKKKTEESKERKRRKRNAMFMSPPLSFSKQPDPTHRKAALNNLQQAPALQRRTNEDVSAYFARFAKHPCKKMKN